MGDIIDISNRCVSHVFDPVDGHIHAHVHALVHALVHVHSQGSPLQGCTHVGKVLFELTQGPH
ncbi:uncharacterized protein ACHE_50966A [Aspergillus chevalieri]|uniref:Uncharacterized protein n=1 Tax=Aspergillus chevalieri TaxID=182096 RepID=A0A7R7VTB0_ASPCH|nr:uncharacterized protein ACHE_50966A [Aspergillus chevalieri]BCR89768.1 hypothetical protein ACHE_50966A [Aspergillus chevalieri]